MTELKIVEIINHFGRGTIVDSLFAIISNITIIFIAWVIIAALILLFDRKKGKWVVLALFIAVIINFVFTEGLFKHLFLEFIPFRLRPYLAYPDLITPIGYHSIDTSFPSGHTTVTVVLISVLIYYYKRFWPYGAIIVILMMLSRIHNGMHWPTDVLGGLALGICYAALAIVLIRLIKNKISGKINLS
jgi:undecaprenyl-diphosphatase